MQILICPGNFNYMVKDLMTGLKHQLSIVYPRIIYTKHTIYIRPDIEIQFVPPFAQFVRGRHPDYFWTDSLDVSNYFKHRTGVKELKTFSEVVHVVLEKCMSKIKEGVIMAEAKKCDRCGKFYVYNKHEFKGCNIRHRTDTTQSIYFDLCDECIVKLWNFLTPPVETDDAVDHYNKTKEDDKCPDDTSTLDIRKMPEELFSSL